MPLLLILSRFKFYCVPACSIQHDSYVSFVFCMPYHIWHVAWIWLYVFFPSFSFGFLLVMGIDLNEPNNGKASILCEASRLLKDLLCQIQSLKKENVSLLSESHYVRLTLFLLLWSHHFTLFFLFNKFTLLSLLHVEFWWIWGKDFIFIWCFLFTNQMLTMTIQCCPV
jgi:hypothetical protein